MQRKLLRVKDNRHDLTFLTLTSVTRISIIEKKTCSLYTDVHRNRTRCKQDSV